MKHPLSMRIILLISPLFLILCSCTKDKDLDDFRNEKLQADLAEYKAVEGSYSGYLISKINPNINLGALQINLTATTQTANSNDGSRAMAQPILLADINYHGTYEASIVGTNSVYEPNSGHFHTEIDVPIVNETGKDVTEKIMIEGAINNGILTGSIYVASASNNGGKFELKQNSGSLQDLAMQRKPDIISNREAIQKIYKGFAIIPTPEGDQAENSNASPTKKVNVQLNINQPIRTRFDEIYYILKPLSETYLFVSFYLQDRVPGGIFPNAIWNNIQGTLRGTSAMTNQISNSIITLTLTCSDFRFEDKNYNFECTYLSSMVGKSIKMTFTDKTK